jgi:hypothetical protein
MFKFITKLMSCGHCGTDAPHEGGESKCVACECPCDEHKEHSHDCHKCGHAHKEDGHCDCKCS